ncbi:MAG: EF-hand domain-containing protein [Paracoccaceae bacterium]
MTRFTLPAALIALATLPALAETSGATPSPAEGRGGALFAMLDENGDGAITRAELDARKAETFARMDRDGDGAVTQAEAAEARARLAAFAERIGRAARAGDGSALRRADRDGDGRVTLAEYTARAPFFTLLDADDSGTLSRAEFDRAALAFAR